MNSNQENYVSCCSDGETEETAWKERTSYVCYLCKISNVMKDYLSFKKHEGVCRVKAEHFWLCYPSYFLLLFLHSGMF